MSVSWTPPAISTAFNSVNEGIVELKRTGNIKAATQVFDQTEDSFSINKSSISQHANISVEAAIQTPAEYYQHPADTNAKELKKQLNDSGLDISRGLKGLLENLKSDMSEMDKFDEQRTYQDYQQGVDALASILKMINDDQNETLKHIKP
jgi:hypothetical protein